MVARRKVAIERARSYSRLFRDVVQTGLRAEFRECLTGDGKNALTVALRIAARLARDRGGLLAFHMSRHDRNSCNRRQSPVIYKCGDYLRFTKRFTARQFSPWSLTYQ